MRRKSSSRQSFVERHGLWTPAQHRAASAVERAIKKHKLDLVRFSFVDQHGTLRGKTLMASDAARAMRSGVTMTTTLLAKDTSHRTVFPVFTAGGGLERAGDAGRRRFRHGRRSGDVPRAAVGAEHRLGAVRHRLHQRQAGAVLDPAALSRCAGKLAKAGFDYCAGLEVEFHLFKIENPRLAPEEVAVWPPEPPDVSLTTQGFQYLTENRFDQVGPIMDVLRETVAGLGMPLRSQEVELGPEPVRVHLRAGAGHRSRRHHGAVSLAR